jgi:hypothetical protein
MTGTGGAGTGGAGMAGATTGGSEAGGTACTLVSALDPDKRPSISFDRYHTLSEMETYFGAIATSMPTVARYQVLGQSSEGRDIFSLVINATCQEKPPAFLAIGAHHGDEKSTSESVLATADYLLKEAVSDPVKSLLQRYAVYLLPVMNPDGFATGTRTNANGVDLNRDYSYPGRDDANSFAQVETQVIKSLQDSIQFRAAVTYHSGTIEVIWPWCYTSDPTADYAFFAAAGKSAADAMSFAVYQQSYDDYPSRGEYIDYAYWKHQTLAATFEVSVDRTPTATLLPSIVDTTWKGTLAWLRAVSDKDSGTVPEPPVMQPAPRAFPVQTPLDSQGNKLE